MNLLRRKACLGLTLPVLFFLFLLDPSVVFAQFQRTPQAEGSEAASAKSQTRAQNSEAAQAIKALAVKFKKSFDEGNAQEIARFWAPEGEYIAANGMRMVGQPAIEKAYTKYFKEFKKAKVQISVDSVRQIGDHLAIEEGRAIVSAPETAPDLSRYTATYVKRDGKWMIVSMKEARLAPLGSHYAGLKDLEWLVGNWVAEGKGVQLQTAYHWLPGEKFIERTFYSVGKKNRQLIGKQIIGVDPISGDVMSWTFNTDGSHAVGIWTAVDNGWLIESRGVTSDGVVTSAHDLITKIDQNGCSWRSVNRTANGVELPDALEVVSKRK